MNRRLEATAMQSPTASKRDSPLDLSVKTIRQSADSTAHDDSENSIYNHHLQNANYPATQQMRPEARHSHLPPQLPYANLATAAVSLPNVHNHSSSAFSATQRQPYPPANPSPAVYTPETPSYRVNNGVQEDAAIRHPVSEYRNEKMTFSFTYEQKQQMHRTQVNAQVSATRFSQYYQNDAARAKPVQQLSQQYTSMNQLIAEKNFTPTAQAKAQNSAARKRRAYNETPTPPMKNPRVSLEWRESIDKEIENRLNAYTSQKAREQEEKAKNVPDGYREQVPSNTESVLRSNLEKDTREPPKLPFTQYLEQHKAQHKLPVQPIQAYPHQQWYQQKPHLSNQYPNTQPYKPRSESYQDGHALKFNKTSFESGDLKIIEKVENVKHDQEQRPLPPFRAFSMQSPDTYSQEGAAADSVPHAKLKKCFVESETTRKSDQDQSRAALMASALAHPRIRTKAELKQVNYLFRLLHRRRFKST